MPKHKIHLLPYSLMLTLAYFVSSPSAFGQEESLIAVPSPFQVDLNAGVGSAGTVITFDSDDYGQLRNRFDEQKPFLLTDFLLTSTLQVDVHLRPIRVMPEGAKAQVISDGGAFRYIEPQVATFSGYIEDQPGSYAFLAISPNMLNGYFIFEDDQVYVLSSGNPKSPEQVTTITEANDLFELEPQNPWTCQVMNLLLDDLQEGRRFARSVPGTNPVVKIADIFVEGDHQFRGLFSTSQDAADYVVTLFATASDIYRRDLGAVLRIPSGYLRIWETVPPWGVVSTFDDIYAFSNWWKSVSNPLRNIDRAVVHLLTTPVFGGVALSAGGLCSHTMGYGISSVFGYFPVPLQHTHANNWDPFVLMHELGHTFGSIHTFNYNPPIECDDGSGPDLGTIMSYCHQTYGVGAVGMRFHARVQEVLRNYMAGVSCLELISYMLGDYNYNGVIEQSDLDAALMCINLQFDAAGCLEAFDLDEDGVLTMADYDLLNDCNNNGIPDLQDIAEGTSQDCTGNGIPDECEPDCNENGVADSCDIFYGTSPDLDNNGIPDECQTLMVPSTQYPSIQSAIDSSGNGFIIEVTPGTYYENLDFGWQGIGARDLILRSSDGPAVTTIDGGQNGGVAAYYQGEGPNSILDGFTIINGLTQQGGGIYCQNSSPTIKNCIITNNYAYWYGGGVFCSGSAQPTIVNCAVTNNTSELLGGGIFCWYSNNAVISNCTIYGNVAVLGDGGGICSKYSSNPTISDTILWNNTAVLGNEIFVMSSSMLTISYSDVQGGLPGVGGGGTVYWGAGNITADPLFATGSSGDFYLSQIAAGQGADSPCVDTGSDTAANLGLDLLTTRTDELGDASIVDMGYHYRPQCILVRYGDVNDDGEVNLIDLMCMLDGLSGIYNCPGVTFNDLDVHPCVGNMQVNLNDLLALLDTLGGQAPCPDDCI